MEWDSLCSIGSNVQRGVINECGAYGVNVPHRLMCSIWFMGSMCSIGFMGSVH